MKKILSCLIIISFSFLSCSEKSDMSEYEDYEEHPNWTDSTPDEFWK